MASNNVDNWKELYPRKIRRNDNGKGTIQYTISLPSTIANRFRDGEEFVVSVNYVGQIILSPINDVIVNVKESDGSANS